MRPGLFLGRAASEVAHQPGLRDAGPLEVAGHPRGEPLAGARLLVLALGYCSAALAHQGLRAEQVEQHVAGRHRQRRPSLQHPRDDRHRLVERRGLVTLRLQPVKLGLRQVGRPGVAVGTVDGHRLLRAVDAVGVVELGALGREDHHQ